MNILQKNSHNERYLQNAQKQVIFEILRLHFLKFQIPVVKGLTLKFYHQNEPNFSKLYADLDNHDSGVRYHCATLPPTLSLKFYSVNEIIFFLILSRSR